VSAFAACLALACFFSTEAFFTDFWVSFSAGLVPAAAAVRESEKQRIRTVIKEMNLFKVLSILQRFMMGNTIGRNREKRKKKGTAETVPFLLSKS
jgi:ABC-type sugar transport system ATPase subunit